MPLRLLLLTFTTILLAHWQVLAATNETPKIADESTKSNYYLLQYVQKSQQAEQSEPSDRRKQTIETTPEVPEDTSTKAKKNKSTNSPAEPEQQTKTMVTIESDEQRKEGDTFIATGYVVLNYGVSTLQADKIIYNSVTGDTEAEGNVIYDPDNSQRLTAAKASLNVLTRKGTFYQAQGFTDQTVGGDTLNFVAERIEKTSADTYLLYGASLTACEQTIPAWQMESKRAKIRINHSATINNGIFRFKNIPIFFLPTATLPIGRRERQSGFLIPSTGSSTQKGRFFQDSYYQTLGRSADLTLRGDVYSKRGLGFGAIFRAKTDELSSIKFGTFSVADRLFSKEMLPNDVNASGTLFFAKSIQYLPHGFIVGADVDFTTSLDFRRTFGSDLEQVFNPENRSQLYVTNNFFASGSNYSFNILAEGKTDTVFDNRDILPATSDRNIDISIRHLPSFELTGHGQQVGKLPLYLAFDTVAEGLSRRDRLDEAINFITPTIVQRFDMSPKLLLVVPDLAGWVVRPEFRFRSTYYSNSLTPITVPANGNPLPPPIIGSRGSLSGENVFRKYAEFNLGIRPPSLAKIYNYKDGTPHFKHLIEPIFNYHVISGINNFDRIIRFDARDTVANTNEVEYGVTNRFFMQKETNDGRLITQEVLSVALTQKYFFDNTFGGALRVGTRNQFYPIDTLSGFTFGSQKRDFSPLNINVRYRPLNPLSADVRMDYDTEKNKIRNFSVAGSYTAPSKKFSFTERFYKLSKLQTSPGVIEPGTFPGSLLVSSINIGNEERGYYYGGNFTYDFTNNNIDPVTGVLRRAGLRRSSAYIGYACDCGSVELNVSTINVSGFHETRFTFSFFLSGIGTFGTDRDKNNNR